MNELTQHQKDILIAFANNDMKIHRVAKQLNYSRNTIDYHLKEIEKVTGTNPRSFRGLMTLILKIQSETFINLMAQMVLKTVDELRIDDGWILCGEGKPAN